MGITAKELAKKMGISAAAVSMALNDKPGVSAETRKKIKHEAEKYGYDFSKIKASAIKNGKIHFVIYKKSGVVVADTPFYAELSEGISKECQKHGYKLRVQYYYESDFTLSDLEAIQYSDCIGIILLATELNSQDLAPFLSLPLPVVILDGYFESVDREFVTINNTQGAYRATQHLIRKVKSQPGYLMSSYKIQNFAERYDGFKKAVHESGLSRSQSIIHELSPSIDGAYHDMCEILAQNKQLARCYFADNDLIAVGAMRAFKEAGYRLPADIAIIGFDNLPISQIVEPSLSTINVPKSSLGSEAVKRLIMRINDPSLAYTKTQISASLVDRYSV
jgi:LacI family transcriptional regulator